MHFSNSINVGAVREFVKLAASLVAQEVSEMLKRCRRSTRKMRDNSGPAS